MPKMTLLPLLKFTHTLLLPKVNMIFKYIFFVSCNYVYVLNVLVMNQIGNYFFENSDL